MTKVILLGSGYIIAQLFPQQHNWREYLVPLLLYHTITLTMSALACKWPHFTYLSLWVQGWVC